MAAQIPLVATTFTTGRNSKKRPASPSHNGPGSGGYGASKKKKVSASSFAQGISMETMSESKMASSEFGTGPVEKGVKPLPFKDPNFVHSGHGGAVAGKKNRTWKNLKQILAAERALPWQLNDPNYFSIDAPPSFKPAKKYSDVSGLLDANEENGEQEAENEEEEGDGEEEDGGEDEEAEAATGKRAAEDNEDDDVDTKKQKTGEDE
ncbi:INO80 complex subunit C [Tupaia chinensis]|uniref:INO80 complex subunit C n=1 Tax=Tupaia chinensis TaxID=246437 RepID=L9KNV2_TUPCH|nr:INO80 complex subunit C [Tupaia chinensis]